MKACAFVSAGREFSQKSYSPSARRLFVCGQIRMTGW